ncbi:ATP-binding protein [Herbaspirillum sp. GCM10030257]|uniref:ATP-binding protein n=1 Tax=Herbaspirillum sp. GCM10030257 TaxID=3273393 RepID=UPI003606E65C
MNGIPKDSQKQQVALTARVLAGRAFLIRTPVCTLFYAHLERWLTCGMLGAIVYGRPRFGKSSAARWALSALKYALAPVPWIEVPVRRQHKDNEGAFFQHLLQCTRNQWAKKGTVTERRNRLTDALTARAKRSPVRTVILFFDEAHLLNELHYSWLINISNELEGRGLRLFCLLVGQQQLLGQKANFIQDGRDEYVARFMTEDWALPGISSYEEFARCLKQYDDAIYPADSERPFASYYLPEAVRDGWHIQYLAKPLYETMQHFWADAGRRDAMVIPMHYVTSSLVILLNELGRFDASLPVIPQKTFQTAVSRSGFGNALISLPEATKTEKRKTF